ncbi:undecaprenyl-phosphate glucose phosphotransferase [Hydrogenophaga sp.]|uniref:undecaprenyl-phosphate glucose phosphotransferase n=1 Tax=Hydrogenophaga sp. TaxID=1904254 RepID=UPI00262C6F28|nr:undecaprenyl-phosphate glucose phosphotransferase [Hydrogenophaga sp.]MDM7948624.1 undecaprenyl-phosphate glucose phosphotransferase [Hydrogenophaga sp.]
MYIDQSSLQGRLSEKPAEVTSSRSSALYGLELLLSPAIAVSSLWALAWWLDGGLYPEYLVLAVLVFSMTFPGESRLALSWKLLLFEVLRTWSITFGLLVGAGMATGYVRMFPNDLIFVWVSLVPAADFLAWLMLKRAAPVLVKLQGPPTRAIVIGMNEQGLLLAGNLRRSPYMNIEVIGFADDRPRERLPESEGFSLLGDFNALPDLVKTYQASLIYISLPMVTQPRILNILDGLKDTTASIYFVPDLFVTDLIQSKPAVLCGVPVISVCDTPFRGLNGMVKRGSDIALSALILLGLLPLLVVIGLAIRMTSPGPAIFKQRRYGQDGQEIVVYKFRSMTVAEDGLKVHQVQRNDKRVTRIGALLRKTSLDELPQFFNVLQGRMSIVGPRPHAVAHNELYRKLIKGYMVRHKVRPGITGWAQVNGYRGETDTLDKMQGRIDFDLDYLRNWSLKLDLLIILKTIRLVFKDQAAF